MLCNTSEIFGRVRCRVVEDASSISRTLAPPAECVPGKQRHLQRTNIVFNLEDAALR